MARLEVGQPAPDFTLPAADGGEISLSQLRGDASEGVIVYFFPAAGTPGCTKQAIDFRDAAGALGQAGYRIIGISPDSVEKLATFASTESLDYPLAADPDKTVLEAYGAWGEKKLYGKVVVGVIRSTFVIGTDGTVAKAMYNVRATGHVAKLQRELGID